jgi:hypothetical protein
MRMMALRRRDSAREPRHIRLAAFPDSGQALQKRLRRILPINKLVESD